jgi:hypothetical protein
MNACMRQFAKERAGFRDSKDSGKAGHTTPYPSLSGRYPKIFCQADDASDGEWIGHEMHAKNTVCQLEGD